MCDTMVALGNSTKDGSVIFAKNSDRQPNEPHIMIRIPRKEYQKGEVLKCTYIAIEQADKTNEVLLLKPSWIWGAEMGSNEFGLTIGNEAVFTKEKQGQDSLLGMDMLRIALERCKTSEEALDMLIELLETYGQGGNCGYEKDFVYHNSFLIADRNSAWVLETAGEYWVAEKIKTIRSISNCLSIGKSYDRCHKDLIKNAIDKGYCKTKEDFHFAKCYTSPLFTSFSKARERSSTALNYLEEAVGNITIDTMKLILRSHTKRVEGKQFTKHSINSICMHGGFLYGDHTTGSYIASLNGKLDTHWLTGSSTPCISIFKPFWFIREEELTFTENEKEKAIEYWKFREKLHRMILANRITNLSQYLLNRDKLENTIEEKINEFDLESLDKGKLLALMNNFNREENQLISKTIEDNKGNQGKVKGNPYFRRYWKKQNEKLFNNSTE